MTVPSNKEIEEFNSKLEEYTKEDVERKINQSIWTGWRLREAERFVRNSQLKEIKEYRKQSLRSAKSSKTAAWISGVLVPT